MTVVLARVDNRLIHGQVLEGWIPRINVSTILVVDDGVADDSLRRAIMEIAVPSRIYCRFFHVQELKSYLENGNSDSERIMILFSEIQTVRRAIEAGIILGILNIGNVHYEQGKQRITSSVSLNDEEICWLSEIDRKIPIDIRATPDDAMVSLSELLEKARGAAALAGRACLKKTPGWRNRWPFRLFY